MKYHYAAKHKMKMHHMDRTPRIMLSARILFRRSIYFFFAAAWRVSKSVGLIYKFHTNI